MIETAAMIVIGFLSGVIVTNLYWMPRVFRLQQAHILALKGYKKESVDVSLGESK